VFVYAGHQFVQRKEKRGLLPTWLCRYRGKSKYNCSAKLKFNNDVWDLREIDEEKSNFEHSHAAAPLKTKAEEAVTTMRREALEKPHKTIQMIVAEGVSNKNEAELASMPTKSTIEEMMEEIKSVDETCRAYVQVLDILTGNDKPQYDTTTTGQQQQHSQQQPSVSGDQTNTSTPDAPGVLGEIDLNKDQKEDGEINPGVGPRWMVHIPTRCYIQDKLVWSEQERFDKLFPFTKEKFQSVLDEIHAAKTEQERIIDVEKQKVRDHVEGALTTRPLAALTKKKMNWTREYKVARHFIHSRGYRVIKETRRVVTIQEQCREAGKKGQQSTKTTLAYNKESKIDEHRMYQSFNMDYNVCKGNASDTLGNKVLQTSQHPQQAGQVLVTAQQQPILQQQQQQGGGSVLLAPQQSPHGGAHLRSTIKKNRKDLPYDCKKTAFY